MPASRQTKSLIYPYHKSLFAENGKKCENLLTFLLGGGIIIFIYAAILMVLLYLLCC